MLQATKKYPLHVPVEVAGAVFEVVGHNADGTLNLKNDQGHVFSTSMGEPIKTLPKPDKQVLPPDPRGMRSDDYVAAHILHLLEMRKATLDAAEQSISAYVTSLPGTRVPVGINAVTWLEAKPRPTKDERRLLTAYTVAAKNLRADIRTDQNAALSLWTRLNPSFDEEEGEGEQALAEPARYSTRPRG